MPAAKPAVPVAPDDRPYSRDIWTRSRPPASSERSSNSAKRASLFAPTSARRSPRTPSLFALADQTLVGWQRFHDDGPPDRLMGLLYAGFQVPPRAELGDDDPAQWPLGLTVSRKMSGSTSSFWSCRARLTSESLHVRHPVGDGQACRRKSVAAFRPDAEERTRTSSPSCDCGPAGSSIATNGSGLACRPRCSWSIGKAPRGSYAMPDTCTSSDMNDEIPF